MNEGIAYEEVKAYQVSQGVQTLSTSGGYTTGGIYIMWDVNSGFTGQGWLLDDLSSPAHGYTEDKIRQEVETNNNLDKMFSAWTDRVHYETRYPWIFDHILSSCRYEA